MRLCFKAVLVAVVFFTLPFGLYGQSLQKIPMKSGDSAEIIHNDSLYRFYLSQSRFKEASSFLDKNAMLYWKHNYFDEAADYFLRSIELNKKLENYDGIAKISTNLALIYADKGDYQKAYEYFENTLAVRKSKGQKYGTLSALKNESVVLNKLKRYDESVDKLEEALAIARELNDMEEMRSCYGMLAETYQKAGNSQKSLYYYNFFKTFNDYINQQKEKKLTEETIKRKIAELEAEKRKLEVLTKEHELKEKEKIIGEITEEQRKLMYSLTKQEMAIKILEQEKHIQSLENQRLRQEQKRKNLVLCFTLVIIIGLILFSLVLWRLYRQKKKLLEQVSLQNKHITQQKKSLEEYNEILQEKNSRITESIVYAKNIQNAIFSRNMPLDGLFEDSFIINKPKDIVSGDFYFTRKVGYKNIVVLADCTGHGVPGAFLTILGYNLLEYVIRDMKELRANEILRQVDTDFVRILNQLQTGNIDGMEMSVCIYDENNNTVQYSGAGISLLVAGDDEIREIRLDKDSIGYSIFNTTGLRKEKYFKMEEMHVEKSTWFYIFSDGIVHLMNEHNQKFSKKRLKSLLKEVCEFNGQKQKELIEERLEQWQGSAFQVDDMMLIGVRFP